MLVLMHVKLENTSGFVMSVHLPITTSKLPDWLHGTAKSIPDFVMPF